VPSFDSLPVIGMLRRIGTELDDLTARAASSKRALDETATTARRVAEENRGSFQRIAESAVTTRQAVQQETSGLAEGVEATRSKIATASAGITEAVRGARATVQQETSGLEGDVQGVRDRVATKLDDLIHRAREHTNAWDVELDLQLQAVQLGLQTMEEFLFKFGEGVVRFKGETTTVRELLAGIDYRQPQQEMRDLIKAFEDGAIDLDEVVARLRERAPELTRYFLQILDAFRQGKVTLDRLAGVVESFRRQFGDTELSRLMDDLVDQLNDAQRDGTL